MNEEELKEYLAGIRKTIAESNAMVEQARLRIAETDRLLESQGLTREQVLGFKVSREAMLAVNEELRRRGLPPIEGDDAAFDFAAATDELRAADRAPSPPPPGDELAERQRKFGAFMQEYRL